MAVFTPDQPWLYLLLYGSFIALLGIIGLIINLNRRRKKKKEESEEETVTE